MLRGRGGKKVSFNQARPPPLFLSPFPFFGGPLPLHCHCSAAKAPSRLPFLALAEPKES